ncbi:MAG: mechanosensitive ion channel family protein [Verrucomicrobiae bacterium]|nr:mechanosensitive ion channel family protein [Verrucomicrobiae bacterium]
MKRRADLLLRIYIAVVVIVLGWCVWSSVAARDAAAAPTNAVQLSGDTAAAPAPQQLGSKKVEPAKSKPAPRWVEKLSAELPFLKWELWGNALWKYLFSFVYIFLAFYVSKLVDYLTRFWLRRWAERTETKFDDLLLDLLRGPVKVIAFVFFLRVGLDVFEWPDVVQKYLSKAFAVVVACAATYLVLKFVDLLLGYWRMRSAAEAERAFDEQLFPLVRKAFKLFIIVVAVLVTLTNIGVDVTAAIASLSIGGLAVGLAAQDTLANLFGAVAVFIDKPFRIGDRIQLENVDGVVESIGLRSTRVRNLDGHLITVPNKTMGNTVITNITRRPNIRTTMNISITYDTPAPKVKRAVELLHEIYRAHPKTHDVWISFNKFADSSLNILVIHWWAGTDYKEYLAGIHELNLRVKERFDAEGINFAFPTQTIYLKHDSGATANVGLGAPGVPPSRG